MQSLRLGKENFRKEIKPQFPEVEVEYIDMLSEKEQKMVREHSIMSSPGIIMSGELFSAGGLNKEKLIEKLKSLIK